MIVAGSEASEWRPLASTAITEKRMLSVSAGRLIVYEFMLPVIMFWRSAMVVYEVLAIVTSMSSRATFPA